MAVKAVEMVRKIRDKQYKDIKRLSLGEQIKFYKKKSEKLQKTLKKSSLAIADNATRKTTISQI
ncbi:MAG: hypothetical protein NT096_14330 [Proteobacteria bacterium]|nr:hypothetical protein [Pseudomonadota bacterium]